MPKLFKSKIFLFTLFVVMIGSISSIKEQLRERGFVSMFNGNRGQ